MINAIMIIINIIIIINNIIIRQEAVDYMEANTALSRVAVEREVENFMTKFCIRIYLSNYNNLVSVKRFKI